MLSSKPYLLRALYDWILDSGCTPHIVVDALLPNVQVPSQFVKNGQIILNISPGAVVAFSMEKEVVSFSARFGGVPFDVLVPLYAVVGIYAKENGQGMMFEPDRVPDPEESPPGGTGSRSVSGRPSLRVVK